MIEKVEEYLKKNGIGKDARILVGFSGGIDSSVLLDVLTRIFPRERVFALHIQHMMRDELESQKDLDFCQSFASQLGVEFFHEKIKEGLINSHSEANKCGLEASARYYRYQSYDKYLKQLDIDYIALGHHLDDNVETLLLRFLSGSSVFGLQGIPQRRDNFIRPMIDIPLQTIEAYATQNNIACVEDITNEDNAFKRNLIRNEIFPFLNTHFPGLSNSLINASKKNIQLADYIQNTIDEKIKWQEFEQGFYIDFSKYKDSHDVLKSEILFKGFNMLYCEKYDSKRLPSRFVDEALMQLKAEGDKITGNGIVFEVFLDKLYFYKAEDNIYKRFNFSIKNIELDKEEQTPFGKVLIKRLDKSLNKTGNNAIVICPVDNDFNGKDLSIRTLDKEDEIFYKGKKRNIYSYLKKITIPQHIRDISYVVINNKEIVLLIIPYKQGECILSEQSLAFVNINKYYMYIEIINDGDQ